MQSGLPSNCIDMVMMGKAIASLFLLLISPAVYAQTTHSVGWDTGVDYVAWAKGKTFSVGDSLLFTYGGSHAVDEVPDADYTSCSAANAITTDSNSPTTIALSAAGPRYFICPRSNHCSQGMKLAVNVTDVNESSPSPPSGGPSSSPSPPSGGSTPSPPSDDDTPPPPATSTPTSPSSPAGNAATIPGGGKGLMVGLSVVFGAMLGLMG